MKIITCVLLYLFWRSSPIYCMKKQYIGIGNQKPSQDTKHTEFEDRWFLQKLDHFNPTNDKTWKQRYQVNDVYYKKDGPIFLFIQGEIPISNDTMVHRAWIHYAEKLNALCFQLEHRYYGNSHPTENMSNENLIYLSSQQALADLARFIVDIPNVYTKHNISNSAKWIVFGGSYAGSLAAWLRMKYPHLVFAAVSSSAPLLAKLDFKEYFEEVENILATYSPECIKQIRLATQKIDDLLQTTNGQRIIHKKFKLCDPQEKNKRIDANQLFLKLARYFWTAIQDKSFKYLCDIMVQNSTSSPLDRYAKINDLMMSKHDRSASTKLLSNADTSWTTDEDTQWTYQTCTELGFFQTSNRNDSAFRRMQPLDNYVNYCIHLFGNIHDFKEMSEFVKRTNMMYGGLNIQGSRIIYVHGSKDPWRVLGITKTKVKNTVSIYINGATHGNDMYRNGNEHGNIKKAHSLVIERLRSWLIGNDSNKAIHFNL